MKLFVVLVATLGLLLGASAASAGGKKDPPPKKEVVCSPGYWKNHTEVWIPMCCDDEQCDLLFDNLSAKGPSGRSLREAAQAFLTSCFPEEQPCVDD